MSHMSHHTTSNVPFPCRGAPPRSGTSWSPLACPSAAGPRRRPRLFGWRWRDLGVEWAALSCIGWGVGQGMGQGTTHPQECRMHVPMYRLSVLGRPRLCCAGCRCGVGVSAVAMGMCLGTAGINSTNSRARPCRDIRERTTQPADHYDTLTRDGILRRRLCLLCSSECCGGWGRWVVSGMSGKAVERI